MAEPEHWPTLYLSCIASAYSSRKLLLTVLKHHSSNRGFSPNFQSKSDDFCFAPFRQGIVQIIYSMLYIYNFLVKDSLLKMFCNCVTVK